MAAVIETPPNHRGRPKERRKLSQRPRLLSNEAGSRPVAEEFDRDQVEYEEEPDAGHPWHRMAGEPHKAYGMLRQFLDEGPLRTYGTLARRLKRSRQAIQRIGKRWRWYERAEAFDKWALERRIAQAAKWRERAAEQLLVMEVERQQKVHELADRLLKRIGRYLEWPHEQVDDEVIEARADGTIVIKRTVRPANWTMDTIVRLAQTVKDLYAAAVDAAERVAASRSGVAEENAVPGFFRVWCNDQIQHLRVETPTEGDICTRWAPRQSSS